MLFCEEIVHALLLPFAHIGDVRGECGFKCRLTCLHVVQGGQNTDVGKLCDATSMRQKCKTL